MVKKRTLSFGVISFVMLIGIISVIYLTQEKEKDVQYAYASWNYSYKDIQEISEKSDVIAIVSVIGTNRKYMEQGIPFTEYNVEVVTPIYGSEKGEILTILMTGMENDDKIIEIIDDPLMKAGEEFLIFCWQNDNGTYTILGGPQGRLEYQNGRLNSLNPNFNINIVNAGAEELINEIKSYVK
ncbi:MAG: hypothetical protein AB7V16_01255 [Vulcanibacillus sp.]